jgi:acetate kinase
MSKTVLVINAGSSSIKYQLLDPISTDVLAVGLVERIGLEQSNITHEVGNNKFTLKLPIPDHTFGLEKVIELFEEHGPKLSKANIVAIGHRVVQGGTKFPKPVIINDQIVQDIKDLISLAPLHNGANAIGIEVAKKFFPNVPHVAVFDTSFFHSLPDKAATYAIDKTIAKKYGIKRYGAHGTSHQYVGKVALSMIGKNRDNKKVNEIKQIVLHLGNGASASAQIGNFAIETSMGITPLEGLVMGTRSGDIDPAVSFLLSREANMSTDEIENFLNKQSGINGLSGLSDMRDVRQAAVNGDKNAIISLKVYIHRLLKYVGAYTAILGGLDCLTFTAGVGENDVDTRAELLDKLALFGIKYSKDKNKIRSNQPRIISTPDSSVQVMVIPTNEELAIAQFALELI